MTISSEAFKLYVILPAYNEELTIGEVLDTLARV